MTALLFLDRPGKSRFYLRRIAGPSLYLWHPDQTLAMRLDDRRAARLATWFQVSSRRGKENTVYKNYQPAGKYGVDHA
jgi:hypothetical protein